MLIGDSKTLRMRPLMLHNSTTKRLGLSVLVCYWALSFIKLPVNNTKIIWDFPKWRNNVSLLCDDNPVGLLASRWRVWPFGWIGESWLATLSVQSTRWGCWCRDVTTVNENYWLWSLKTEQDPGLRNVKDFHIYIPRAWRNICFVYRLWSESQFNTGCALM